MERSFKPDVSALRGEESDSLNVGSIFTIGYGSRSIDEFVCVLIRHGIQFLGDVRSRPYSRFNTDFSQEKLDRRLALEGITYVFLGDTLGGMPQDSSCYTEGRVDYTKVRQRSFYHQGLTRLKTASQKEIRLALMCSEQKPQQCHRSKLIGESLVELGIPVFHIDEREKVITHADVMRRLNAGQVSLPGLTTPANLSRNRYDVEEE